MAREQYTIKDGDGHVVGYEVHNGDTVRTYEAKTPDIAETLLDMATNMHHELGDLVSERTKSK